MKKSRLVKHAYEEGHRIQWKEAKAVQTETNNACRKRKESVHTVYIKNNTIEPSLEICSVGLH
jgi:hypothetical protein